MRVEIERACLRVLGYPFIRDGGARRDSGPIDIRRFMAIIGAPKVDVPLPFLLRVLDQCFAEPKSTNHASAIGWLARKKAQQHNFAEMGHLVVVFIRGNAVQAGLLCFRPRDKVGVGFLKQSLATRHLLALIAQVD